MSPLAIEQEFILLTTRFFLSDPAQVRLSIGDLLGRELDRLVDGAREAGSHEVVFEAGYLPSGMYLLRLETPASVEFRTVTLLK